MSIFHKKDLTDKRGEAYANMQRYQQKYANTGKESYNNKANFYEGKLQAIDKLLERDRNTTNIKSTKNSINYHKH